MTIFEAVRHGVTARQAAELYGLKFDRTGRGFCPWHNDGKHPGLQFFRDGGCYCHVCHMSGDATDITAQMLSMPPKQAAWKLYRDFHLDLPIDKRPDPETQTRRLEQKDEHQQKCERYSYLCDVVHEADARLRKYTPETADAEFDLLLAARCKADQELNLLWEELKRERT